MKHKIKIAKNIFFTISIATGFLYFSVGQNIGDIHTRFCQEIPNNEMNIVTQADKETEICMIFENKSESDVKLNINFVDGAITPNGNRACLDPDKAKPNFGQYILPGDFSLEVPAKSEKQQSYKIKFPVGYSGISHGCVLYSIQDENKSLGAMKVVFSKSHSIDILVGGVKVKSKIKAKRLSLSGDQIHNRIVLDLENQGNTNQSVNITGIISNFFGYSEYFEISDFLLEAGKRESLSTQNLNLPDYKGFFSIKIDINYQPHYNFHITNIDQTTEYTGPGTISFSKTLILRNWFYVAGGGIIVILLIILTKKIFSSKDK